MKLLLITLEYPPQHGGIATLLSDLFAGAPEPDQVAVMAPHHPDAAEFDAKQKYRVFRRKFLRSWMFPRWFASVFAAWRLVGKLKPKRILISHVLPTGHVALVLKRFHGIPYLVYCHGTDILSARKNPIKRFRMQRVLRNAETVIANSKFTAELLKEEGVASPIVITPCVKLPSMPAEPTNSHPYLLSVGRLVMRKGFDVAIKAMAIVGKELPDAQYTIVGDGPDRPRLEAIARSYGVTTRVRFAGKVKDVRAYLKRASIFVHPARRTGSDVEGFGIAVLEASSYGVPVVVGESGGAAETVIPNVTGVLVKPTDEWDISRAIVRLATDPEKAKEMGEAGRVFTKEMFDPDEIRERFWKLV